RFSEALGEKSETSADGLWKQAVDAFKDQTQLAEEDFAALESLGKTLGYLDKQMQINAIQLTLRYIDTKVSDLQTHCDKNKKMYRHLGVLGGLLLAVILW
ncbi:MAG: stage III sporulation protein AB, partial [Clostridiales bacterium]|nr:stage III sporulation protein AB [Clostridiales bacterium]